MVLWIAVSVFAGILSFLACSKVIVLAEKSGMIVQPGDRQSHVVATPTGGGLGLILSLVVTTLCLQMIIPLPEFWWQKMLPGILILAFIGWRDDKHHISSRFRLLVQLAVSVWMVSSVGAELSGMQTGWLVVTTIAVIWMMNLYNFMDGSNGMAGFQGVFAGLAMAILFQIGGQEPMALVALAVAAACMGFLPLNFPIARVFMGDVASVPLGFILASMAVYGVRTGTIELSASVLIMSLFIIDATLTLLARAFRGERWYTAHAQHVYQRLIAQGRSHHQVLVVYQAINVILVAPAIVLAKVYPQSAFVTVGLTLFLLGICWHITNKRLGMVATEQLK